MMEQWRHRWRDERGDVLMEYVVVTVLILLPLIGAASILFDPSGGPTLTTDGTLAGDDFGVLGNAMAQSFRRLMCGIALPVP